MDSRSSNDSTQKKKTAKLPAKCSRQSWVSEYHISESEESSEPKSKKSKKTNKSILDLQRKDKAIEKSTSNKEKKQESSESSEKATAIKKRKRSATILKKSNKMLQFVTQLDVNTLQCNYCIPEKKWERVEGCKFQSGNITTHMMSVHKDVMEEYGMLDVEKVYEQDDLNCDILEWLITTNRPLLVVEDVGFRKIITNLGGKLLKRSAIKNKFLPVLLERQIKKIKLDIVGIKKYSITSDGWTTSLNKKIHWSSTTLHWIDRRGFLQTRLLDIGDLGTSATAAVIKDLWDDQIERWNLDPEGLMACVVDGGANYKAASKRQAINVYCCCHRLNLLVKDILYHGDVLELYKKCKQVTKSINKSISNSQLLVTSLRNPTDTRWNSAHLMFRSRD